MPRKIFILSLSMLLLSLQCLAANKSKTKILKDWVILATYPVISPERGKRVSIEWRYEVKGEKRINGDTWLNINVRDMEGITPVEADFWLDPVKKKIWRIRIRDRFHGQWHEHDVGPDLPANFYLSRYSPVPLDYYGMPPAGETAEKAGTSFRRSKQSVVGKLWRFRTDYILTIKDVRDRTLNLKNGILPEHEVIVRNARYSKDSTVFWFSSDFPWWLKYQSPHFSAQVIKVDY